jgi:RNA polymerase sigma-B factor
LTNRAGTTGRAQTRQERARDDPGSRAELSALHERYFTQRDPEDRSQLLEGYRGLARSLATRAARQSDDLDDLVQVAMLGILHALERFDPDRGVEFTTFAWATIQGELKRYRRDHGWTVHVPRRLQEAYLRAAAAVEELGQQLGRQPSLAELATRTGDDEETIIQALDVRSALRPASLDARLDDEKGGWEPAADDRTYAAVEDRSLVDALLGRLPPRERQVLEMRFVETLTQAQIAERTGYSQMHVSRILSRALERLREWAEIESRALPRQPVHPPAPTPE